MATIAEARQHALSHLDPPLKLLLETDFGAAWQMLNGCILRLQALDGLERTKTLDAIADLRRAMNLPGEDEWTEAEKREAYGR